MNPIKLEDLIPEGAEFKLRKTGKTYRMRPVSLADEQWMAKRFGKEIEKIFSEIRMPEICLIIFRLLDDESKSDFLAQEVTFIDEDSGEKSTKRIGGAELMFYFISGFDEKMELFSALMRTIGISRKIQDELLADSQKKTVLEPETNPEPAV